MGAVTLHWGLGNPTLKQRHNATAEGRRPQHTRKYCHFWLLQRTWIILNDPNTCVRSINRGYSKGWNQMCSQTEHFLCVTRVLNDGPWTHQPAQFGSAWHDFAQLFQKAYFNHICPELISFHCQKITLYSSWFILPLCSTVKPFHISKQQLRFQASPLSHLQNKTDWTTNLTTHAVLSLLVGYALPRTNSTFTVSKCSFTLKGKEETAPERVWHIFIIHITGNSGSFRYPTVMRLYFAFVKCSICTFVTLMQLYCRIYSLKRIQWIWETSQLAWQLSIVLNVYFRH